jgi:hypothetical protein
MILGYIDTKFTDSAYCTDKLARDFPSALLHSWGGFLFAYRANPGNSFPPSELDCMSYVFNN